MIRNNSASIGQGDLPLVWAMAVDMELRANSNRGCRNSRRFQGAARPVFLVNKAIELSLESALSTRAVLGMSETKYRGSHGRGVLRVESDRGTES